MPQPLRCALNVMALTLRAVLHAFTDLYLPHLNFLTAIAIDACNLATFPSVYVLSVQMKVVGVKVV
jgi:hypothetical protein